MMPNQRSVSKNPTQLRRLAEQQWKSRADSPPRLSNESDVRRLLQELQVHQIELEIQNSDLQTARDEAAALLDAYAELYDLAPVGFLTLEVTGKIKHANLTAASILGVERSRLLGSFFPQYLADSSQNSFASYAAVRRAGIASTTCDLALRAARKRTTWIRIEASNQAPSSAEELKVAFFDITERKWIEEEHRRYEAEFQHIQKLESLGALAAGVAHDMNNVLAAIGLVAQTLKVGPEAAPDLNHALDIIDRATNRGRDMVGRLTAFARKELREPEPIDLNALLQEEANLLRRTTLQKVEIALELEPRASWVMGERGRLEGAIMNLCVNALEAMAPGGRLTLGACRHPGSQVEIFVKDTGIGMAPEVLERATEPFFTTKPRPNASGLGLSMAYATANVHGGSLNLWSEPGMGTTVGIRLPEFLQPETPQLKLPSPEAPGKPLTILLVDDDMLIRETFPGLLERMGHRVEAVAGGQEALDRLVDHPPFDLVLLDKNMPGMDGLETLTRLRQQHPTLPVILVTGDLQSSDEVALLKAGKAQFLAKPFTGKDLAKALNRIGF